MERLKIKEALAYAIAQGKQIDKKELSEKLFPDCKKQCRYLKMLALIEGRVKRVNPEHIITICEETGVSAGFLFGLEKL